MERLRTIYGNASVPDGTLVSVQSRYTDPLGVERADIKLPDDVPANGWSDPHRTRFAKQYHHDVPQSQLTLEEPDEILSRRILLTRTAEFTDRPWCEHNEEMWTQGLPLRRLNLKRCATLPELVLVNPSLLLLAIEQGYEGAFPGRDKLVAAEWLRQHSWIKRENAPADQDWLEREVMSHYRLWGHLDQDRKETLVTKALYKSVGFVEHILGKDWPDKSQWGGEWEQRDWQKIVRHFRTIPEHAHERMSEALAAKRGAKGGSSKRHPELARICRFVTKRVDTDAKFVTPAEVRAYSFETIFGSCRAAVAVGVDAERIAIFLREEVRKRKVRMSLYSDDLLGFLVANLPEVEARALDDKFHTLTKKRDRNAYEEDDLLDNA